jgi:hypothetical protein
MNVLKDPSFIGRVAGTIIGGKAIPFTPRIGAEAFANSTERLRDKAIKDVASGKVTAPKNVRRYATKEVNQSYDSPSNINYAQLSKKAYDNDKTLYGYKTIPEFSTEDRTVYQQDGTGHVVIAFRGTNVSDIRDTSTDLLLAAGATGLSHRFYNAENVTSAVIKKYGRKNVTVTGHSLGGSQALHVSRKFGVNAYVYNPHVSYDAGLTGANYKHANIFRNTTDPVPAFSRAAYFKSVTVANNPQASAGLGQHSIDYWVSNQQPKPQRVKPGKNQVSSQM